MFKTCGERMGTAFGGSLSWSSLGHNEHVQAQEAHFINVTAGCHTWSGCRKELLPEEWMVYYRGALQVLLLTHRRSVGSLEMHAPSERLCAALALNGFGTASQNSAWG